MQEINLYQPVSKGVRGALSARSTSTSLVLVCATLAGLWGFAFWQTGRLQQAAQIVRSQQQAQAALSAAQGPQLAALSDEELDALVARLSSDYDNKSRALALLNSESQQRAAGFSSRLRAFAARHTDGVWLDRLTFGSNVESVSVSGSTVSPDSVPQYLRSLAQDPALKGGQIDEFVIERPKDKKAAVGGRLSFHARHRGLAQPEAAEEDDS
jgi:Tfp pilus assembly protein PilN